MPDVFCFHSVFKCGKSWHMADCPPPPSLREGCQSFLLVSAFFFPGWGGQIIIPQRDTAKLVSNHCSTLYWWITLEQVAVPHFSRLLTGQIYCCAALVKRVHVVSLFFNTMAELSVLLRKWLWMIGRQNPNGNATAVISMHESTILPWSWGGSQPASSYLVCWMKHS